MCRNAQVTLTERPWRKDPSSLWSMVVVWKREENNDHWQKLCTCPIPSDLRRKIMVDLYILYKWYILGNLHTCYSFNTLLAPFWGRIRPKEVFAYDIFSVATIHSKSGCAWLSVGVLSWVWVWRPLASVTVPYLVYTCSILLQTAR